jgi:CheY-like chemotaxis protein
MTEQDIDRHTILLVEDEPDLRNTLKEILEMEGYYVVPAENGQDALHKLELLDHNREPCLIFLDLMMPVMNGWQFLEKFQAQHQALMTRTPIVIVSAASDVAKVQESFGCSYLRKPVDLDNLFKVAKEYCNPA